MQRNFRLLGALLCGSIHSVTPLSTRSASLAVSAVQPLEHCARASTTVLRLLTCAVCTVLLAGVR